ncbi:hypothetical protein PY365_13225 [Roseiarcaceae bacterium H3SJ34-1]|uniref:hypothetical protein n=1 Tax=Terripilifer ovatus TaxID=3032367 RepID=UPI003AB99406|nr:hypothetical protein [Roseiarcaceae bacterium H3SJ34-1]
MHTIYVLAAGFCLLAACLLASYFAGGQTQAALPTGALCFIPLWLAGAALNMWHGVTRAGYSVADETPIFLLVFAIPAAVAFFIRWKYMVA